MGCIKHSLSRDNQKRMAGGKVMLQEIFGIEAEIDEDDFLALALILCNVTLDAISRGRRYAIFINPRSDKLNKLDLIKFFLENSQSLIGRPERKRDFKLKH